MKRSALGYNFYVNPFSSHAADVFHYFAYIISATIVLPTWYQMVELETTFLAMYIDVSCYIYMESKYILW